MPASEYVRRIRSRIGNEFLLLPAVTAVIQDADRFLLARHRDSLRWSLIGGGVEPGEQPSEAVLREVREELGVDAVVRGLVGAYGGEALEAVYPNGDRVGYVTVAFRCSLKTSSLTLENEEIAEVRWATIDGVQNLSRHEWIDEILNDAARRAAGY